MAEHPLGTGVKFLAEANSFDLVRDISLPADDPKTRISPER